MKTLSEEQLDRVTFLKDRRDLWKKVLSSLISSRKNKFNREGICIHLRRLDGPKFGTKYTKEMLEVYPEIAKYKPRTMYYHRDGRCYGYWWSPKHITGVNLRVKAVRSVINDLTREINSIGS